MTRRFGRSWPSSTSSTYSTGIKTWAISGRVWNGCKQPLVEASEAESGGATSRRNCNWNLKSWHPGSISSSWYRARRGFATTFFNPGDEIRHDDGIGPQFFIAHHVSNGLRRSGRGQEVSFKAINFTSPPPDDPVYSPQSSRDEHPGTTVPSCPR